MVEKPVNEEQEPMRERMRRARKAQRLEGCVAVGGRSHAMDTSEDRTGRFLHPETITGGSCLSCWSDARSGDYDSEGLNRTRRWMEESL
ncbi:hypothetical protein CVT26_012984 [Gymnopilus dilepis]|uniref:Uncharacterized protein n=1 Tax=Gymnopilus dilepis TaxID=231916 RepID=A0A409XBP1_9AGAR|nr:hypothetical protein CVT26_012984 [Gymnopilus dilepis]